MINKSVYLVLVALLFSVTSVCAQSTDELKAQLAKLTREKEEIAVKLKELQQRHSEIHKEIKTIEEKLSSENSVSQQGGLSGILSKTVATGGVIRDKPTSTGAEVESVKGNEDILVLDELQGLYFKVSYKGKTGWMNYNSIQPNSDIDRLLLESTKPKQPVDDGKLQRLTKLYGTDQANKIIKGILWAGESQAQVIESIGRPRNTTKNATDQGIIETWEYNDQTLTFVNGDLKKW